MDAVSLVVFGVCGAVLLCILGLLFASRWDRGVQDIAAEVNRISGASRAVADTVLATVRVEVADLLDVRLDDVTAKGTYGMNAETAHLLRGVEVTVYAPPVEALVDTANELETSVQSLLAAGGDIRIRVRAKVDSVTRSTKRAA